MEKKILEEYTHACILLKETEKEIQELEQKQMSVVLEKVKGGHSGFPCQARSFAISGTTFDYEDDRELRKHRQVLEERKARAKQVKLCVEEWMNSIPMRMQRIIKYKFFKEMTWEETAAKISGKATGDSIRMEYHNFMKNKK